jgi:hypothetical protein
MVGVAIRVGVDVAFRPGFVHSDGPGYLRMVDHLYANGGRPVGYSAVLWLIAQVDRGVDAISIAQQVLGLLTAVVLYAVLRRWAVSAWVATLAVLPLLVDQMQLVLEHSVMSDVLFMLLLVLGVAALAWWRAPRLGGVAVAGLLFGAATLVRIVGEPSVLAAAVFCLVAAGSLAVRARRVVVLLVCFVAPLVGYAGWYHQSHGVWALTDASSRSLYMRTTTFVDCSRISMPDYERALCPPEPVGERLEPTQYGWNFRETLPPLVLPAGVTREDALHDFAWRAIRAQPLDYLRTVARDVALAFWPRRDNYYEYGTAQKWSFHKYIVDPYSEKAIVAYAEHGGVQPTLHQPWANFLDDYDEVVYLPGPLLFVLLLLAVAGLFVRRPNAPPSRPLIFLLLALGMGLITVPDMVTEFVWRYQLPAIILIPPAAALAWARLRTRPEAVPTTQPDDAPEAVMDTVPVSSPQSETR